MKNPLTEYLKKNKITQADFATKIDISPEALTRLLKSESKHNLSLIKIAKIAKATGGDVCILDLIEYFLRDYRHEDKQIRWPFLKENRK